ncbi:ribose-phosphate pyrophosphokinase [Micractinium conductrix]|uniref:ribose-phosphate diphosphokinase n=1 Tax=Micractinium conductrix TaxID=554055 RepID=A0A2P6VA29_9CHLO|nr:ribose-phosphate pyrophosphokinase [Micractinium conductrix]|eukprot:PSC70921.1 ribose-phosphate pyrophosphokinase [Micractinium conductrix]
MQLKLRAPGGACSAGCGVLPKHSSSRVGRLAAAAAPQVVRAQSGNGAAAAEAESSANGGGASSSGRSRVAPRPILAPPSWESTVRTAPQLFPRGGHQSAPNRLRVFSGTSNTALSQEVACYLGLELGTMKIKRFADGEIYVQVGESIRGCDVFLIQPTTPPVNDNMMELLIMIDACKRASARSITAVLPYFGYARADRKTQGREAIAAKLSANIITEAGADRVLAMDLHSGQCVGYFDIPVDHVYGDSVILDYLSSKRISSGDLVVVSPDVGGVARARAFAKKLNDAPLAIVDKRRSAHNVSEVMNLIGDVRGKVAVLVDDMIDTAGTITNAAKVLHAEGAREVYACATHAVFSPPAVERLSSGIFQEVIVANTIPVPPEHQFPELTVLSVANLLGEAIWRVYNATSVAAIRE